MSKSSLLNYGLYCEERVSVLLVYAALQYASQTFSGCFEVPIFFFDDGFFKRAGFDGAVPVCVARRAATLYERLCVHCRGTEKSWENGRFLSLSRIHF